MDITVTLGQTITRSHEKNSILRIVHEQVHLCSFSINQATWKAIQNSRGTSREIINDYNLLKMSLFQGMAQCSRCPSASQGVCEFSREYFRDSPLKYSDHSQTSAFRFASRHRLYALPSTGDEAGAR